MSKGVMVPQNVPIDGGALDRLLAKVWYDRTHKPDAKPIGSARGKPKPKGTARRRAANKAAKQARRRNR